MRKCLAIVAATALAAACADDAGAPGGGPDTSGRDARASGQDAGRDPTSSDGVDGENTDSSIDPAIDLSEEDVGEPIEPGLSIAFDERFDDQGFFASAAARSVLDEAARQWGLALRDDFAPIEIGTWVYTRDPEDTSEEEWITLEAPIDDLLVFVGSADVGDAAARSSATAGFPAEEDDPELRAELMERWEGDDFEPWSGWIAYNSTRTWFFDETPATGDDIPSGSTDALSVTLHELGHVLGVAPGGAFGRLMVDGTFVGPRAMAIYGGPVPLADSYGHLAEDVTVDGQVPIMAAGRTRGVRYGITRLDIAMLADVGYEVLGL